MQRLSPHVECLSATVPSCVAGCVVPDPVHSNVRPLLPLHTPRASSTALVKLEARGARLNAGITLSLIDLSPGRAQVVRQLNAAGIPVTAGLALSGAEGFYLNASNAAQGEARFRDFRSGPSIQDCAGQRPVSILNRIFRSS